VYNVCVADAVDFYAALCPAAENKDKEFDLQASAPNIGYI